MRPFIIMLLIAWSAQADERVWTIATGVHTTRAELVAVRGDMAYLKTGDQMETVPIANLSPADQEYISSLPLAPIAGMTAQGATDDILPIPGNSAPLSLPSATSGTSTAPSMTGQPIEEALPPPTGAGSTPRGATTTSRSNINARSVPRTSAYRAPVPQSLGANNRVPYNANARRNAQAQPQARTRTAAYAQRPPEPPPGLLNFRARRAERLRGR
jgi:hypothetical protein